MPSVYVGWIVWSARCWRLWFWMVKLLDQFDVWCYFNISFEGSRLTIAYTSPCFYEFWPLSDMQICARYQETRRKKFQEWGASWKPRKPLRSTKNYSKKTAKTFKQTSKKRMERRACKYFKTRRGNPWQRFLCRSQGPTILPADARQCSVALGRWRFHRFFSGGEQFSFGEGFSKAFLWGPLRFF